MIDFNHEKIMMQDPSLTIFSPLYGCLFHCNISMLRYLLSEISEFKKKIILCHVLQLL